MLSIARAFITGLRRVTLLARLRRLEREASYMQAYRPEPLSMAAHRVHINRTLQDLRKLEQQP